MANEPNINRPIVIIKPVTADQGEPQRNPEKAWPVSAGITPATAAVLSSVASSATNVTLLASNSNRRGAIFFNDSTSILYLKFGATASTSSFTYRLIANATLELPPPVYTGIVDGLWTSANGNCRVTEIT